MPRGGKIAAMPCLKTDDRVRIYYEEHGTGTPLVLAYGIGGNATMSDVNVPGLAARHRLILWEPRGHARSDSPDDRPSTSGPCSTTSASAGLTSAGSRSAPVSRRASRSG